MLLFVREGEELNAETLQEFIKLHQQEKVQRYTRLENMYTGNHGILYEEAKERYKPDNRLVVNFAKYIVDTLNGYFLGNPVKTVHENSKISDKMKEIAKRNGQNDNNAELSKMCSIYGHAFELLYQDEESNTRVTYLSPNDAFVVFDDTVEQNIKYGVRVLHYKEESEGYIYTDTHITPFTIDRSKNLTIHEDKQKEHFYGDVPMIEYVENEERQSAFENVETLINAYDKAISEKANDVDYFADAYLAILGVALEEKDLNTVRDKRILNFKDDMEAGKIVVEFLDKPNADTTQENLINRLETLIFQMSMVANIDDDSFGTSSGIALKYKLQSMENISLIKERKFTKGMMKRFKMMFKIPSNFTNASEEDYLNIDYVFSRNIPNNTLEEADTARKLQGIVSEQTQLSVLSVVDNVRDEIDRKEEAKNNEADMMFERDMNSPFNANVALLDDKEENE